MKGSNLLFIQLYFSDRGFFGFLFGQVVPEQRPVALTLPPKIQIEGHALLCLPCGDRVRHIEVLPIARAAMVNGQWGNVHNVREDFRYVRH